MNAIVAQTIRQHATPHNVFGQAAALSFFRDGLLIIAMVVRLVNCETDLRRSKTYAIPSFLSRKI